MAKIVVPRLCLRLQQQLKELAPYLIGIGINTLLKPNVGFPLISRSRSRPSPPRPPPLAWNRLCLLGLPSPPVPIIVRDLGAET